MPHATFGRWLERLLDAVAPGGLLIFTTHGEVSASNAQTRGLAVQFDEAGFFWHPAGDQRDLVADDYGTSMVTSAYVLRALQRQQTACRMWGRTSQRKASALDHAKAAWAAEAVAVRWPAIPERTTVFESYQSHASRPE